MNKHRRESLRLGLGLGLAAVANRGLSMQGESNSPLRYLLPARWREGDFRLVGLDDSGMIINTLPLPARGHGVATHKRGNVGAVFARRPGDYLGVFSLDNPNELKLVPAAENRRFYGHGVFSGDGRYLYATENDFNHARGVIGVYDLSQSVATRVGEFSTFGVGPHDIQRLRNTDTLVVCNGGIQTHPDSGREKLNINTMRPSVALVDRRNGAELARYVLSPEYHQVSLRHLAIDSDRVVWIAGQLQAESRQQQPLLATIDLKHSHKLSPVFLPDALNEQLQGYISSIAVNGQLLVVTSARGNAVVYLDKATKTVIGQHSLADCSGITANSGVPQEDAFLVSSGTGELATLMAGHSGQPVAALKSLAYHPVAWDNHAFTVAD